MPTDRLKSNIGGGEEELLRWRTNCILLYVTWWWSYDRNMLWQTEEEKRNCYVDWPTLYYYMPLDDGRMTETCCGKHQRRRRGIVALTDQQYTTVCHLMMVLWPKHVVANIGGGEEELLRRRIINCWIKVHTQQEAHYSSHNSWLHIQLTLFHSEISESWQQGYVAETLIGR
jgi:hypothetical protein